MCLCDYETETAIKTGTSIIIIMESISNGDKIYSNTKKQQPHNKLDLIVFVIFFVKCYFIEHMFFFSSNTFYYMNIIEYIYCKNVVD